MRTVIIYNPNSTGDGEANARQLARQLKDHGVKVSVRKTQFAKHGEEIAAGYAKKKEAIVLISSSGDGGYHEVVNGVLRHPAQHIVVGVLPSGNANDHYTALGSGKMAKHIKEKKFRDIDTIKVTGTIGGKPWVRYAHSYVGLGVSAVAAKRLTIERPDARTEKWIVAHSLASFKYVKVKENGRTRRYSSLVFSNIDKMSKVIKLSEGSSVRDGKFEIVKIHFHSKLRLLAYLLTAATVGLKDSPSQKRYECQTIKPTSIQLDGEVYKIDANTPLVVEAIKQNLRCVL